jgi:hypothetical protein
LTLALRGRHDRVASGQKRRVLGMILIRATTTPNAVPARF